jgi:hypothetical protein
MGVKGGNGGIGVAKIDLELTEVLTILQEMSRIGMTKSVYVRILLDAASPESQAKASLQRGATEGTAGRGRSGASSSTFGREEKRGMAMGLPLLAEQFQGALGQGNIAITIALATADVEEHALGVDVTHLETQTFTQAKAAGVDGGQTNAMVQPRNLGENTADFLGRENHRQLELGIGADQFQLLGPGAFESLFPEELESADELGGGLAGHLLDGLQVDAVLADLLEIDQFGRAVVVFTDLANTGQVSLLGARTDGQELKVVGEGD